MKTIYSAATTIPVVALALLALVVPADGQSPQPAPTVTPTPVSTPTPEPRPAVVTVEQYRRIARAVYRHRLVGVGDYRARPEITRHQKRRLVRMKSRARGSTALRIMRAITEHQIFEWRFFHQIDLATPWGEFALPWSIIYCESKGNYTVLNQGGSDASGAYQFLRSTWLSLGGGQYASEARYAPPWAQHLVANKYRIMSGTAPWSCA